MVEILVSAYRYRALAKLKFDGNYCSHTETGYLILLRIGNVSMDSTVREMQRRQCLNLQRLV